MRITCLLISIIVILFISGCMESAWKEACEGNTISSYKQFVDAYPDSEYVVSANNKIEDLKWKETKTKNNLNDYIHYLSEYPNGKYTKNANIQIEEIEWQKSKNVNTRTEYIAFIKKYPSSQHVTTAYSAIEKIDMEEAVLTDTVEAYEEFMMKYPSGYYTQKVQSKYQLALKTEWNHAVRNNDLVLMDQLNKKIKPQNDLLFVGVNSGNISTIEKLLDFGCNIEAQNADGDTPLMLALWNDQPKLAEYLIAAGANMGCHNNSGYTPLIAASARNQLQMLKRLLLEGVDVNTRSSNGSSALLVASYNGFKDIVVELLKKGADVDVRFEGFGNQHRTAIYLAKENGHNEVAELLQWYSIHEMCKMGNVERVEELLNAGFSPNKVNLRGQSPLQIAVDNGHSEVVKMLLQNGADSSNAFMSKELQQLSGIAGTNNTMEYIKTLHVVKYVTIGDNKCYLCLYLNTSKSMIRDMHEITNTTSGFLIDPGSYISLSAGTNSYITDIKVTDIDRLSVKGFLYVFNDSSVIGFHGILLPEDGSVLGARLVSKDTSLGESQVKTLLSQHNLKMSDETSDIIKKHKCSVFRIESDGAIKLEK